MDHLNIPFLGMCGDAKVGAIEECDDGNTASGDGCSSTCTNEGLNAHKTAIPLAITTTKHHSCPSSLW